MGEFSLWHLILILGVILIFFGPSRLPGLGNSLGKAIRGFKDGIKGLDETPEEKEARKAHEALSPAERAAADEKEKSKTTHS